MWRMWDYTIIRREGGEGWNPGGTLLSWNVTVSCCLVGWLVASQLIRPSERILILIPILSAPCRGAVVGPSRSFLHSAFSSIQWRDSRFSVSVCRQCRCWRCSQKFLKFFLPCRAGPGSAALLGRLQQPVRVKHWDRQDFVIFLYKNSPENGRKVRWSSGVAPLPW